MVVDDHSMLLKLVCVALKRTTQYDLKEFNSPDDLLNKYRSAPDSIRLVLTDYNMPQMDGPALCDRLHEIEPDLPVVLMSANPRARDELGSADFSGFLCKPFGEGDLHKLINTLIPANN
tara:strand:- start:8701 stop:9057 length:357 start_codon:yes stop_codon:yes gene_type:complete